MYVLFIARGYPTEKYLMNGVFEFDQAKALANLGCKVVYLAIDLRSIRRKRKWGYEFAQKDNVYIHALNIPWGPIASSLREKIGELGARWLYNKVCRLHGTPDILHGHFTGAGYIAMKLARSKKIPFVVTEHSSKINQPNIDSGLFRKAHRVYNEADVLIAVSPALQDRIKGHFGVEAIYIPNMVETDIFEYKGGNDRGNGFRMVSTGNLIKSKRMDLTVEAFSKVFAKNPFATLTIFGDGPERKSLQQLICVLNMEGKIRLAGLCPREEIARELSKSDCFVLASESETFGVAYIEALASGVPVIATRCGGPEGFVNEHNGILIDSNNLDQLIAAMDYMLKSASYYNRDKISLESKRLFSPKAVGKQIKQVYMDCIEAVETRRC